MKEKPILWSAPMVLALLAGRKTQTRRIIKLKRELHGGNYPDSEDDDLMAPYAPGDRLWGREAWRVRKDRDSLKPRELDPKWDSPIYIADHPGEQPSGCAGGFGRYRSARFMMRWMSRLLHDVTDVRAERLQEITEADARAEGLERFGTQWSWPGSTLTFPTARDCYLAGWDTINGEGSAASNPWVWVIGLKPAQAVAQ